MRLKYLFFPITLVLAMFIFVIYMIPAFGVLKKVNASYKLSEQALQGVRSKKVALEALSSQLKEEEENNVMVLNYLPINKTEERIIGGANYLAVDAGVALVNVSLKTNLNNVKQETEIELSGSTPKEETIKTTEATIEVVGDYDKLKIFFNGIQHMSLLNSIKSLSVTSKEDPEQNSANSLSAKLVVDFGYLSLIKADNQKLANFQGESAVSLEAVKKLKEYTSKVVPEIKAGELTSSRTNPFRP